MIILLLAAFSAATSLATEAFKLTFDDEKKYHYSTNIVVLIISIIVGCGGTAVYFIATGAKWDAMEIILVILMGPANWICATCGYDKVKQTIKQLIE